MSARIFRFDDWTLNLSSGELERGGVRARLQEHPLQVLASLLDNAGQVVTREQLIAKLWPTTIVDFDTGLNTAVRKLRAALGDTAETPRYIETIPRRGYRFIGTVRGEERPALPAIMAPATPIAAEPAISRGTAAESAVGGASPAATALAPDPAKAATLEAAGGGTFGDRGRLVKVGISALVALVVLTLVGWLIQSGTFRHTVRITAQLVNATTGFHIWSETYDRNVDDVLTLQSDIANAVANALKVTLLNNAAMKSDLGGTRNPQALDAYLRGLKLAAATLRSAAEARQTIAAFTEAIDLDPNFALAYTARARTLVEFGAFFMIDATHETFSRAKVDATRAATLEPDLGEAHAALAEALEMGFLDFAGAGIEYERAIALSPGSERVLRPYSRFAGNMGHIDVGVTTAKRCVELDPLNVHAYRVLGEAYENARRFPDALAAFDAAVKLNPTHATEAYQRAGRIHYLMGDIQKAKAACEAEPDVYHLQACMPLIYEKLGQHEAARAALAIAMETQKEYSSYQWAQVYAQWGQPGKAIDWLEKGVAVLDPGVESMKVDPFLDPLRSEPRFQALLRALNFPP